MKKLPLFLFIGAVAFLIYALVYLDGGNLTIKTGGSSKTETSRRQKIKVDQIDKVHTFDKIEVDGIFKVVVTYGSQEKIELQAPGKSPKEIKMKIQSGTLLVKLDKSTALLNTKGAKIHVYTAKLNEFILDGAASVTLNNTLNDDSFSIKSSGAATFKGDVDVEEAEIELAGGASIELSGTAKIASLNLSGAGHLGDFDFNVNKLNVDMNGLSSANITCLESLEGEISGISKLNYAGKPSVKTVKTSGSATLEEK